MRLFLLPKRSDNPPPGMLVMILARPNTVIREPTIMELTPNDWPYIGRTGEIMPVPIKDSIPSMERKRGKFREKLGTRE